jgi:sortase A
VLNRLLGYLGRFLVTAGVLILLFVGFQLWGTGLEQAAHQDALGSTYEKQVLGHTAAAGTDADAAIAAVLSKLSSRDPATAGPMAAPAESAPLGVIEIPRIGLRQFVVEGTAKPDLKKGPGHYTGTPLPGQAGNAAIAGHRTTYGAPFNRIDELVPGDPIYVTTTQGRFRYEVMAPPDGVGIERGPGWFSVKPSDTQVIADTSDNRLTLTACHPKRSAQQRIVVQAKLSNEPAPATTQTPSQEHASAETVARTQDSFGGDATAKWPALGFAALAGLFWFLVWLVVHRPREGRSSRRRWMYYVLLSPGFFALLWVCFVYTDRWLPSF